MINFIKNSKFIFPISIFLLFMSCFFIFKNKINLGLEFTGGIEIELQFHNATNIQNIKKLLSSIKDAKIKHYGSNKNILIKIKNKHYKIDDINSKIKIIFATELKNDSMHILRIDYIGSEVNKETIYNSSIAIILAIISMITYLTYRFEYKFAISATLTLCHDMLILIGIISLLKIELNLNVLAALFAIFGYSINDTVVVFDRVREHIKLQKYKNDCIIINSSINATLSRTIITSLSTLFVSITLMLFGGESLFNFSLILSLGIIIGTYSSIYIAVILTFYFGISKKNLIKQVN